MNYYLFEINDLFNLSDILLVFDKLNRSKYLFQMPAPVP